MPNSQTPISAAAKGAAAPREQPLVATRAHGRSLTDFKRLRPAERLLLDCSRRGEFCCIGVDRPESKTKANSVRADFVRFLVLGGDERSPVHEHGVQLQGAWLTGALDLEETKAVHGLLLQKCVIESIEAIQAELKSLNLGGCQIGALFADRLRCYGSIFLRNDFRATGEVRLLGAIVHGNLICKGGLFEYQDEEKYSLSCDGAVIHGTIMLSGGFKARGGVNLIGTEVTGDIICTNGHFHNSHHAAICFDRATIRGRLLFRNVSMVEGHIDLSLAQAGSLVDDSASWTGARGKLLLDGFTYSRLAGGAPVDAGTRIKWLEGQISRHVGEDFRPQPWEQLIAVLRSMGHPNEARAIAIAKQRRLAKAKKIMFGVRSLHRMYGFFVGYGYQPIRLLIASASVWLFCFVAYLLASNPQWFGGTTHLLSPPTRDPSTACLQARAAARSGDPCPQSAPDYENFVPLVYSADVLLPVVDLGYQSQWQPVVSDQDGRPLVWGQLLRFLYWAEIFLGWILGGALVAMLGNLIKKE